MGLEEVEEVGLVLFADNALELEDFAEVGIGFVGDMDQVGLHEGFRRRRPHLEGLEDRVETGHGLRDAFDIARWDCRVGRGGNGQKFFAALLEYINIEEHLDDVSPGSSDDSISVQTYLLCTNFGNRFTLKDVC